MQLRASYSKKTPAVRASRMISASPAPSQARTPAILHGHDADESVGQNPSEDEIKVRDAALKAFEQASIRKDALKAHGAITDNLLNF